MWRVAGRFCTVFDCVFHPSTLQKTHLSRAFRDLVVQTAMEGVEKAFSTRLERRTSIPTHVAQVVPLMRCVTVGYTLPKLAFKGVPSKTVIRTPKADPPSPETKKGSSLAFMETLMKAQAGKQEEAGPIAPAESEAPDVTLPVLAMPTYTIVHRHGDTDLADYTHDRDAMLNSARPSHIQIRISLPKAVRSRHGHISTAGFKRMICAF